MIGTGWWDGAVATAVTAIAGWTGRTVWKHDRDIAILAEQVRSLSAVGTARHTEIREDLSNLRVAVLTEISGLRAEVREELRGSRAAHPPTPPAPRPTGTSAAPGSSPD